MSGVNLSSAFYASIDAAVRSNVGDGFDYWLIDDEGTVLVRMATSPDLRLTLMVTPTRSYPDAITNPLDPPTVEGTDVTRPI